MFYCKECEKKEDWPSGFFKSYGRCEVCEKSALCSDIPSKTLAQWDRDKEKEKNCNNEQ